MDKPSLEGVATQIRNLFVLRHNLLQHCVAIVVVFETFLESALAMGRVRDWRYRNASHAKRNSLITVDSHSILHATYTSRYKRVATQPSWLYVISSFKWQKHPPVGWEVILRVKYDPLVEPLFLCWRTLQFKLAPSRGESHMPYV